MRGLEIYLNGTRLCIAGFENDSAVLKATVDVGSHYEDGYDMHLRVGGFDDIGFATWARPHLNIGDEVKLRIVADPPLDPPLHAPSERQPNTATGLLMNRSIPRSTVIPVLAYPDANQAASWLCDAFGFSVRLRIGDHRVQLNVGDGAVIVRELRANEVAAALGNGHSLTIRVADADAHCERARAHAARIVGEPITHQYGERQYIAEDLAGHSWTFSESVGDVDPEEWGGTPERL